MLESASEWEWAKYCAHCSDGEKIPLGKRGVSSSIHEVIEEKIGSYS